jgi:hypothetical protein
MTVRWSDPREHVGHRCAVTDGAKVVCVECGVVLLDTQTPDMTPPVTPVCVVTGTLRR